MKVHTLAALLSILMASVDLAVTFSTEARATKQARDAPQVFQGLVNDPTDGTWVKIYTAVGDRFSAAIGAGTGLTGPGDVDCSRYDGSYAELMNVVLGPSQRSYQFVACSGVSMACDIQQWPNPAVESHGLHILIRTRRHKSEIRSNRSESTRKT